MKRLVLYLGTAVLVPSITLWLVFPPSVLRSSVRQEPVRSVVAFLIAAGLVAALLRCGEAIVRWANRGPRQLSGMGLCVFLIGLFSATAALLVYFAWLNVLTAPVGLVLGTLVLSRESKDELGHSLLNLAGFGLSLLGQAIWASHILTGTLRWL